MNEYKMNKALLAAFPELKEEFEEYTSWQDEMNTGAFLTYEDVFRPHIEKAIEEDNTDFLKRVGAFLEDLYCTDDKYAVNVICVGILEGLKANCDNTAVRMFLRPATRKEFDELEY